MDAAAAASARPTALGWRMFATQVTAVAKKPRPGVKKPGLGGFNCMY